MTSLEYGILLQLTKENTLGTELYELFHEYTDAHVRRTLTKMIKERLLVIEGTVKEFPGDPGRPANLYAILPEGTQELEHYEKQLQRLR